MKRKEKNLPHCSILKWCVDSNLLPQVVSVIKKFLPNIIKVAIVEAKSWFEEEEKTAAMVFKNPEEIDQLRTTLFEESQDILIYDTSFAQFPEVVNNTTHKRIQQYPSTLEDKSYFSHISLWFWFVDSETFALPATITFDTLAITRLWNRCSSHEIIEQFSL